MPDRSDSNGGGSVRELVDDSIGPDPQRAKPPKAAVQQGAGMRLALEQSQRIFDSVDHGPVELEQIAPRGAREDDSWHRSARGAARGELRPELIERDGVAALQLGQSALERG